MVDFLHTFHFWRVVREVLVDGEAEGEGAGGVHAFVGVDGQGEVEDVVGVGEVRAHGRAEGELGEICREGRGSMRWKRGRRGRGEWMEGRWKMTGQADGWRAYAHPSVLVAARR